MTKQLKKAQPKKRLSKVDKIRELKAKHSLDVSVDDKVIDKDGRIYYVEDITKEGVELAYTGEDGEKHRWGTIEFHRWERREYIKFEVTDLAKLENEILDDVKDLTKYEDKSGEEVSESRALTQALGKEHLLSMKQSAMLMVNKLEIMNRVLERKKNELESIVRTYLEKVQKIMKVVGLIELYLGIKEELFQVTAGTPCTMETPITIRQQILYMDEEVGNEDEGGIDFRRIGEFDKWISEPANIKRFLPEPKGVVVFHPSRQRREYCDNVLINSMMQGENHKTYILIKNGGNVYRIFSEHLSVGDRLFPLRKEMEGLQAALDGESSMSDDHYISESDATKTMEHYQKAALLLQGLVDRSQVFEPKDPTLQMHKPQTHGKLVNFVYDDELTLPTGRKPYKDWKAELNAKITRGSRIYYSGYSNPWVGKDEARWRKKRISYQYRETAELPSKGIYEIEDLQDPSPFEEMGKEEKIIFLYRSGDTIWKRYSHSERKKAISYSARRSDENVFNYDLLDLDDIEFYLHSRVDRVHYLDMMPVLRGLKKMRLKELVWEKGFVENLVGRLNFEDKVALEKKVWETIEWWKRKNIWKRPLTKDDSKALRMITWKVKKELGLKTTKADRAAPETPELIAKRERRRARKAEKRTAEKPA